MLVNHQENRLAVTDGALAEIGVSAGIVEGDGRIGFWVVYPVTEGKFRFLMAAANDDGIIDILQSDAPPHPHDFALATLAAMPTSRVSADDEIYQLRALGVLPDRMRPSGDVSVGIGIALCKRFGGSVVEQEERFEVIRRVATWLDQQGLSRLRQLVGDGRIALCETAIALDGGWQDSGRFGLRALRWPSESVSDVRAALDAFPGLASLIFWSPAVSGAPKAVAMEMLATFDIPPAKRQGLLRRLAGVELAPIGVSALNAAVGFPLDWIPTRHDEQGWRRFSGALSLFVHLRDAFETAPMVSAGGFGGRWSELDERIHRMTGRRLDDLCVLPGAAMAAELVDFVRGQAYDVAFDFFETVLLPMMARDGHGEARASFPTFRNAIGKFLFGERSSVDVIETAKRWHDRGVLIPTRLNTARSWEAWLPEFTLYDRVSIRQLTTGRDLVDEGRNGPDENGVQGLAHCVGSYASRASHGDCAILSLRTVGGSRLSTAEVRWKEEQFEVQQHYGKANTPPPPECVSALKRYLSCFSEGILSVDRQALARVKASRKEDVAAICGYDWTAEGAIEGILDLWRPYLSRDRAHITLDDLADRFCLSPPPGMMMR